MADVPGDGKVTAPAPAAEPDKLHSEALSAWTRYGGVTLSGAENLLPGIGHALKEDFTTIKGLEHTGLTLLSSAAVGAVLKTALPEGGPAGAIASGLIGAYMLYKSADPVIAAYKKAGAATTIDQVHEAGKDLGYIGGGLIVDTGISMGGYKLGAGLADHVLLSESFDGFANRKAAFWQAADNKVVGLRTWGKNLVGLETPKPAEGLADDAGSISFKSRVQIDPETNKATLHATDRTAPKGGTLVGETDPNAEIGVTVMLKSKATDLTIDRQLLRNATGRSNFVTDDADFVQKFGVDPDAVTALNKFADAHNLKVVELDNRSGAAVLSGKVAEMNDAFGTKLQDFKIGDQVVRSREGKLTLDGDFAKHVEAVLGLDQRPQATPNFVRLRDVDPSYAAEFDAADKPAVLTDGAKTGDHSLLDALQQGREGDQGLVGDLAKKPGPKKFRGYNPEEVAQMYNFPKGYTGKGQGVGIIELSGNLDLKDNAIYYTKDGMRVPDIQKVATHGGRWYSTDADDEVALDSQVIGRMAPGAHQMLIFGPNTDRGFVDTIHRATFTEKGEVPNSVISISWGSPEEEYSTQAVRAMSLAFKKAALKGISVFAASGDDLATDGAASGQFNPDYPSSDPMVTGTGGTRIYSKLGRIIKEVVWHSSKDSGTGGGVSRRFGVPDYQEGLDIPANANGNGIPGRGAPDVAGNADPASGYRIRVNGKYSITGGTSAVAPEKSALTLLVNEALADKGMQPVGFLNPYLYAKGKAGGAGFFNDIIHGDNAGYKAGRGWDAATGWGSIDGQKFLDTYIKDMSRKNSAFHNLPIGPVQPVSDIPKVDEKKAG